MSEITITLLLLKVLQIDISVLNSRTKRAERGNGNSALLRI